MKLANKVKKLREKGLSYAKIALKLGIHPSTAWRNLNNYDRKAESFKIKERRNFLKRRLVEHRGGKCEICGYDKSIRALEFHHADPQSKKMSISKELFRDKAPNEELFNKLKKETEKCVLVCRNCHAEIHQGLIQADGKKLNRRIKK